MVRGLVPFVVLLVVLLGLPARTLAGEERLAELPSPRQVAEWILSDDSTDQHRAVVALRGAAPGYLVAVIRCVRAQHAGTQDAVVASPDDAPTAVFLEARVYSGRRGLAKRLLGEGRMRGSHLIAAAEAEALDDALEAQEHAQVLHAPSLLVADRQWATVKVTTPMSYVKSVRVDRHGGNTVRNPVIDIVEEGLVLEARPVLSADRRFITLAGALTQTAVERPVPKRTVQTEDGGTAEIEAPTIREGRMDLHFTVPDGASIVGTGLVHPTDTERELLVLLTVQRVRSTQAPPDPRREDRVRVVTMEVRLLRTGPGVLERLLGNTVPDPEEPICGLEAKDVVRLLGPGRRGAEGVEVLSAPRITTFDGQHANVTVLNQLSYVKDYEVHKADGEVVLDPIIDTLQDGLVLDLTPTINADRTRVGFETVTSWAVVTRPIAEFKTTFEGQEATIQIPELKVSRIAKNFELAAGGYALIGGFDDDAEGRRTCVLLHASVTDLDEEERQLIESEGADFVPTPR